MSLVQCKVIWIACIFVHVIPDCLLVTPFKKTSGPYAYRLDLWTSRRSDPQVQRTRRSVEMGQYAKSRSQQTAATFNFGSTSCFRPRLNVSQHIATYAAPLPSCLAVEGNRHVSAASLKPWHACSELNNTLQLHWPIDLQLGTARSDVWRRAFDHISLFCKAFQLYYGVWIHHFKGHLHRLWCSNRPP